MLVKLVRTCAVVATMAAALAGGPSAADAADGKPLAIAAGPELGVYYPVAVALKLTAADAGAIAEDKVAVSATPGSVANLQGLRKGQFDFAIVQADQAQDAFTGTGAFAADGAFVGLRQTMRFHREALVLVARRSAKIAKLSDLKGKRVATGPKGTGAHATADRILAALGSTASVTRVETREDGGVRALCRGDVDAAFFVIGQPSALMVDILPRCKARIVPIDGPVADTVRTAIPAYQPLTIPGRLYPSQPKDVKTLGVDALLVTGAEVDETAVATLVGAVRGNLSLFRNLHPALGTLSDESLRPDPGAIPLHAGAAKAFREPVVGQ